MKKFIPENIFGGVIFGHSAESYAIRKKIYTRKLRILILENVH